MGKKIFAGLLMILIGVLMSSFASAAMTISQVELDDDALSATSTNFIRDVERGEKFEVKVHVSSDVAVENVQVEAALRGFDSDDTVDDISEVFDMKAGVTYVKKLTLSLPDKLDQDKYRLRVRVEDRAGASKQEDFFLEVDTQRHLLSIKDVVLNPDEVQAGRAFLTTVRIKNMGEKDEDGVKVTVSAPDLGVSASDFIDEIESGDAATSEELFLRVPVCAQAGEYPVDVEVTFDDGDEVTRAKKTITVTESEECLLTATGAVSVTFATAAQNVARGVSGTVYPVSITNSGATSKTFTVSVEGVDAWGTVRISPSNTLVVAAGTSETANVFVAANTDAQLGTHVFTVTIKDAAGKVVRQVSLNANVVEAAGGPGLGTARDVLQTGLVVLVIILVVIGLIVAFSRLRGGGEESEEETQTYY